MIQSTGRNLEELRRTFVTDRFTLAPLGRFAAFQLSYPWTRDPVLMQNLTRSSAPRSRWKWYRQMWAPNNRTKFAHAIIPNGETTPIGMHVVRLFGHRSGMMYVAIHDRAWWEKGVVLEVRAAVMNHFFQHGDVERFYAEVNGRNIPSIFNYRRLGFHHIGTRHREQRDPVTQEIIDICMFELFRDDWMNRLERADASA